MWQWANGDQIPSSWWAEGTGPTEYRTGDCLILKSMNESDAYVYRLSVDKCEHENMAICEVSHRAFHG